MNITKTSVSHATSALCCFADGNGYIFGAIEGRAGVKNVNLKKNEINTSTDFNFKCCRADATNEDAVNVYACTHVSFNKTYNTFLTAGSDG